MNVSKINDNSQNSLKYSIWETKTDARHTNDIKRTQETIENPQKEHNKKER